MGRCATILSMGRGEQAVLYVFFLGLATGVTILAMSAYLSVSPAWLRRLLLASGVLVAGRYVVMTLCAIGLDPRTWWLPRLCWFATSVGLTLPGAVALDQLVRHPAMTPKKLLRWYAPFFAASCVALLLGRSTVVSDPIAGARPLLVGWALGLFGCAQGAFVLSFLGLSVLLMMKLKSWHIRRALGVLVAAYACLGVFTCGRWPVELFLFSEILTLLAIWFALNSASRN